MCLFEGCEKRACFNYEGEIKALYCGEHALNGMLNIKNKKCKYENCNVYPSFNYNGEKNGIYCSTHRLDNMINVKDKICKYPNCKIQSTFNFETEKSPMYCYTHKINNMIDVKHRSRLCIYDNCKKKSYYNYENEMKPMYCSIHKLDGMINLNDPNCIYPNCKIKPLYNNENEKKAIYCFIHKLENMIDVKHRTCIYQNCKTRANFNFQGEKSPLYCNIHKIDGMLNIRNKMCKTPLCPTQVSSKYDGYCLFCYINTYPDKPVSRNYKTKEYSVVEYVKTNFSHLTWISDKTIQDGCSKRRPDLFLDMGYQIIIIEIDENQHIDYDCSCENKRIMELSQDVGHRPIIFIRFNPDDYTNQDKKISSCWGVNKNGICVIKKTKKKEWDERLNSLKEQIHYWTDPNNKTDKTIEVVQLFYDN